jgi:diguanylate cyclase (GGDEF)-like protein
MPTPFLNTLPQPPSPPMLARLWRRVAALAACDLLLLSALAWPQALAQPWPLLLGLAGGALTLLLLRHVHQLLQALRESLQASQAQRERVGQILDALPAGILLFDGQDRLELVNRDFRQLYGPLAPALQRGADFEALLREAVAQGLVPVAQAEGPEAAEAWIQARLAAHRNPGAPMVRQLPDGRWRRIAEQRLPDGSLLAHSVDISELVQKENALEAARLEAEQARRELQDAIDALPDAFALYDAEDRLRVFNARYREVYALSAPVIVPGVRFEEVLRYGLAQGQFPQAAGREAAWLAERLRAHRQPAGPLLQELPGNRWLRIDERPTRDGGITGVRSDVTELVRREQALQSLNSQLDTLNDELAELSATDELTRLANRRTFDRRLAEEHARALRHGLPLALVLLDVDHFKDYNDAHGHPAGDRCLREVAALLREHTRRPSDLAARWGGEEFALLLPHDDGQQAQALAEQLMARLARLRLPHGRSPVAPHITVSAGVAAMAPGRLHDSPATLVAHADAALYQAKRAGRDRVVVARH